MHDEVYIYIYIFIYFRKHICKWIFKKIPSLFLVMKIMRLIFKVTYTLLRMCSQSST